MVAGICLIGKFLGCGGLDTLCDRARLAGFFTIALVDGLAYRRTVTDLLSHIGIGFMRI